MSDERMATLTKELETKMIDTLTDAYCLLAGSDLGNSIIGRPIVTRLLDTIKCFHSDKMKMEHEREWTDHAFDLPSQPDLTDKERREISRECSSLSNPEDYEY